MNNNDKVFKNIADRYVEQMGSDLSSLPAASVSDKTGSYNETKARIRKRRIKKLAAISLPAAAVICLIFAVTLLNGINPPPVLDNTPPATQTQPSPDQPAPVIQLSGTRFSIADREYDNGKIIYSISDNTLDDNAVIIFEKSSLPDLSDYQAAEAGGNRVYYKAEDDYYILLYEFKNYIVTMSCRYELDTLNELNKHMKINF